MTRRLDYTVLLTPAEEGGFTVTVPALPAIVTEGDTFEEAIKVAREAIDLYVSSLASRGLEIPVETTEMLPLQASVHIELPLLQ